MQSKAGKTSCLANAARSITGIYAVDIETVEPRRIACLPVKLCAPNMEIARTWTQACQDAVHSHATPTAALWPHEQCRDGSIIGMRSRPSIFQLAISGALLVAGTLQCNQAFKVGRGRAGSKPTPTRHPIPPTVPPRSRDPYQPGAASTYAAIQDDDVCKRLGCSATQTCLR